MGKSNELVLRPSYWASVSGGKDSLYMLNLILHNLDRYPLTGVVHFEMENDYPFIHDVIDYMEAECKRHGIPFFRIKSRLSWFDFYDRQGFPTRTVRWCNKLKLDCAKQLEEFMKEKGCYVVSYIGYCANESKRIEGASKKNAKEVYPLAENNICEDMILEWAKTQPIFNDYYKFNRRCGCMWCPMASFANQAYLLYKYPKEYEKMMELAKATEAKRREELDRGFSVWGSNPKYDTEYRDKKIRTEYLPALLDAIEGKNQQISFWNE